MTVEKSDALGLEVQLGVGRGIDLVLKCASAEWSRGCRFDNNYCKSVHRAS